jgi:hypothetical protein
MRQERIQATWSWRGGASRQDCVLVNTEDIGGEPLRGYAIARVLLFFSFTYGNQAFPCALIWWYTFTSEERDQDTGMWLVERAFKGEDSDIPDLTVIHVDSIFRAVHLLPHFGKEPVPRRVTFEHSLDYYHIFYVNKFSDHHSFEIL